MKCAIIESEADIRLSVGDQDALRFIKRMEGRTRGAFIHPLLNQAGGTITGLNQTSHGLFHGWAQIRYREQLIDFWPGRDGSVHYLETAKTWEGQQEAGFTVELVHTALPGKGKVSNEYILFDTLTVSLRPTAVGWLVEYTSEQMCASTWPVVIPEQDLGGGLAFQWNNRWPGGSQHSEAIDQGYLLTGPTEKSPSRLALVSHPENPGAPQPILLENTPGQLFCHFSPVRRTALRLEPGKTLTQRYRLLIFTPKVELNGLDIWTL
ncbi:MAG: hypothetical protein ACI97B_002863 [Verrucomicrobiales bacterium]|jgi:hypothetical protein